MVIQWFPGHMAKAIRQIKEKRKQIDVVLEVLDARAPLSSRNPVLDELFPKKPRILLLNKSDLADRKITNEWIEFFRLKGIDAIAISALKGNPAKIISKKCREVVKKLNKLKADQDSIVKIKLPEQDIIRAVVLGIPNVGKSSLINLLVGKTKTTVGYHPGVTKKQSWLMVQNKFMLLDVPGILWPKFDHQITGYRLAAINCIKEKRFNQEDIVFFICKFLIEHYPEILAKKYNLSEVPAEPLNLIETIGKQRGCFISGNELDYSRVYELILREFRTGKLGGISLENVSNKL